MTAGQTIHVYLAERIMSWMLSHPQAWHCMADAYDAAEAWIELGVPLGEAERRIAAGEWMPQMAGHSGYHVAIPATRV